MQPELDLIPEMGGLCVHLDSVEGRYWLQLEWAALHAALRLPRDRSLELDGVDVVPAVHDVLDRMTAFADAVLAIATDPGRAATTQFNIPGTGLKAAA